MKMYIGNLSFAVVEDDLMELFSEYGQVEEINIVKDRFSQRSKGFAFLEMPNNSEADKAIKGLNGSEFKGKNIKVNQAESRRDKPKRRRRY